MSPTTPAAPAASATPADLARQIFAMLNARDLDGIARLQHEDVVDDFVVLRVVQGRAEARRFFEGLFAAFPDFQLNVLRVTGSGDMAVVEWEAEATFTGASFEGILANGKRLALRGVDCMRFEDGRLRHNTIYYDGAAFARSIGLLPIQGSGAEKGLTVAFNAVTKLKRAIGR